MRAALNRPKPKKSRPSTTANTKTHGLPSVPLPEEPPPPEKPPPPPPPPPKPDDPPPGAASESTASSRPARIVTQRPEKSRRLTRRRTSLDYRAFPYSLSTSVGAGTTRTGGAHRRTGDSSCRRRAGPTEITVSSDQGEHSTKVFRAAIQGDDLGTVEIKFVKGGKTYLTIKLHHAMISSFNVSDRAAPPATGRWSPGR